ncbi:MAG: histidine kinase [Coriobacteriia bacterium]|nr:histidine kinase [Coriobacteriia bacterium]
MRGFYLDTAPAPAAAPPRPEAAPSPAVASALPRRQPAAGARARIAVYDALTAPPRVEDVVGRDVRSLIGALSERTYALAREQGGRIPYSVIREVAENLLHASFKDVVVTILDAGSTIRVADRGPGIGDKDRAFLPGFTTADDSMRRFIKGVGSGLPIVRESVGFSGGYVQIEDNLDAGTVVTVTVPSAEAPPDPPARPLPPKEERAVVPSGPPAVAESGSPVLGLRQKQVLSLVMELGSVGPTRVSRELGVGLSTAYRDLALLEESGLLMSDTTGKRVLTGRGVEYLDSLTS